MNEKESGDVKLTAGIIRVPCCPVSPLSCGVYTRCIFFGIHTRRNFLRGLHYMYFLGFTGDAIFFGVTLDTFFLGFTRDGNLFKKFFKFKSSAAKIYYLDDDGDDKKKIVSYLFIFSGRKT